MGLLLRSLTVLILLILFIRLPDMRAQLTNVSSSSTLDTILQDYAYRALDRPKTGVSYDVGVPSNLAGMKIAAMRLRTGSLRKRGVPIYKEFGIPTGILSQPYSERLVLVYQNLGNWSDFYYPLPGYTYIAPVLGLLAYDATNLSATNLPQLHLNVTGSPISVYFDDIRIPDGNLARCVTFSSQGLVTFDNLLHHRVCSMTQQGHVSVVVESIIGPAPAPAPIPIVVHTEKRFNWKTWIILGSVVGGVVLLGLLICVAACVKKCNRRKEMQQMERSANTGEALNMTSVGSARAPSALVMRTQPLLENEYAP